TRPSDISSVLEAIRPDEIYNFAGPSSLAACDAEPGPSAEVIGLGPLRILDWLRRNSASTRFYQASTSEIFRTDDGVTLLDETCELQPRNLYGIAKLFAQSVTRDYRRTCGLFAC